jgi:hypothetical protein
MNLPEGRLVRSRVVTDPRTPLVGALDRELTGYAVLEPQEALLLDAEGAGVVAFEAGVPTLAHHEGTGRSGPEALADLAIDGPYWLRLFAVDEAVEGDPDSRIPPGMAAERLAGDADLAERTRERAPRDRPAAGESLNPVEAFLEDEGKVEAIRERAREEADRRAAEWGLTDLQS